MATLQNIIQRAEALKEETALNSISPDRAGGIMYDTLIYINQMQLQESNPLLISKIYASVAAMEADSAPVSDLTGKPLVAGQVVCIVTGDPDDPDEGVIYRYDGTTEGTSSWTAVGRIGSDPYLEGYLFMGIATPSTDPDIPAQKVFYIATTPGTYTYLGGLVVNDGEVAILKFDTSWHKEVTGIPMVSVSSKTIELGLSQIPLWESDKDYVIGNQVNNNNHYYRCTTAHTSGISFDATKWTEITNFIGRGTPLADINVGGTSTPIVSNSVIHLSNWGEGQITCPPGEFLYYAKNYRLVLYNDNGIYKTVPYIKGCLYEYQNKYYYWDGANLTPVIPLVIPNVSFISPNDNYVGETDINSAILNNRCYCFSG